MTDLTLAELEELAQQLAVSDDPDEYICGRCHADYHLNDERNEPSALCDGCAQEVAGDVTPRLLAMARELIRLRWVSVAEWPEEAGCVAIGYDVFYGRIGEVERRPGTQRWVFIDSQKDDCDVVKVCPMPGPPASPEAEELKGGEG